MAYLYRHIRLDNNQPFYIGIGEDKPNQQYEYKRAYNKHGRSLRWKDVAYHIPYEVEIMMDGLSWNEACIKEAEFIQLYGRIDLGTGLLVNMTEGGDGHKAQFSKEHKDKISASKLGKSYSTESNIKKSIALTGRKKSKEHCEKLFNNPERGKKIAASLLGKKQNRLGLYKKTK